MNYYASMSVLTFDTELIELFRQQLKKAKRVTIIAHSNPDGDCVGSLLGMREIITHYLEKDENAVMTVLPNACADMFMCLKGADSVIDADNKTEEAQQALLNADLILCVDFNCSSRVGKLQKALEDARGYKILVDHHHQPDREMFPLVLSIPDLSSTCELLYWVILQAWGEDALDTEAARCLYYGICTDTGSFNYACEDSSLYEAAAGLVKFPIGAAEIHNEIVNTYSVARMRFLGFLISERLRVFEEEGLAYFYVSLEDQKRFGIIPSDIEGIVSYTLMMKKIYVGALLRETEPGVTRMSFRSKHNFDVNVFARVHYNGGGHVKASGATAYGEFSTVVAQVEEYLHDALRQ